MKDIGVAQGFLILNQELVSALPTIQWRIIMKRSPCFQLFVFAFYLTL